MVNFKHFSINRTTHMLKLSTCVCELELEDHILRDVEDVLNIEGNRIALFQRELWILCTSQYQASGQDSTG